MSRRSAARVVAALAAVCWGFFFFGLIDLLVPVLETPGFYPAYLLETGWGVLYLGLVALPLGCVAVRVSLDSPVAQVAVAGLAVSLAAVAAGAWLQLVPAAGLVCTAAVVGGLSRGRPGPRRLDRRRPTRRGSLRRRVLLLLALVSTPPAAMYAWDMVSGMHEGRTPGDDITFGLDHWPMQAGVALALPMVAGLASQQLPGWRVTAYTAAGGAAWLGCLSVAYPTHAGSLGRGGGWLALVLATLFVLGSTVPERVESTGTLAQPSSSSPGS